MYGDCPPGAHEPADHKSHRAPLTAAQLQLHPEYANVDWELKADTKERISVAKGRGGPFKLSYELHGHGPKKLLFVCGLGGFIRSWQRQIKDFGHLQPDKYTVLAFDNRGMGMSDKPLIRYTTTEMAKDIVELLDHVGWTQDRSVHVVGVSLGGMISQELALLVPRRLCSLSLISTAPRIIRTKPFLENVRNRINLVIPKEIDAQIAKVKSDCYSQSWLDLPDETEHVVQPFPTNGDRFAAAELSKRSSTGQFTRKGYLLQLLAAGNHHKSAKQLKKLGDEVDRRRILVFHGTIDRMITFEPHATLLLKELGGEEGGVTKIFYDSCGHVASFEKRKEFNAFITTHIEKTEQL